MSIQSVHRALTILSLFSYERPRLGITEISKEMSLPKPTIHGLVQTMVEENFLIRDVETRKYRLGPKVYELGSIYTANQKINQVGAISVQHLAAKTGLTVGLAVWDQGAVVSTFRGMSTYQMINSNQLAPRIPAHCTSQGKAILAWLPKKELDAYLNKIQLFAYTQNTITDKTRLLSDLEKTRERGYAIDHEEYLIGITCMGAPVYDNTGLPIGSLSITGNANQLLGKKKEQLSSSLIQTATEISYKLGYLPRV